VKSRKFGDATDISPLGAATKRGQT